MKRMTFVVFVLVLWLATCSAPQPEAPAPRPSPTQTNPPPTPTLTAFPPAPTETAVPEPKLPAASFDAQTYINEEAGFALEYPAGWTVHEMVVGPRGSQIQFLSSAELAEAPVVPPGQTRLSATVYQWDPKNDLDAYIRHWKEAWSASGFTLLEEQPLTLELGLPAVQFAVQTPESQVLYLVTALEDRYLVIAGEGNLALVEQIVQRVRPVSRRPGS